MLSVPPTGLRWRKSATARPTQPCGRCGYLHIELMLFALLPIFAAAMARVTESSSLGGAPTLCKRGCCAKGVLLERHCSARPSASTTPLSSQRLNSRNRSFPLGQMPKLAPVRPGGVPDESVLLHQCKGSSRRGLSIPMSWPTSSPAGQARSLAPENGEPWPDAAASPRASS
jgi:hypothetical protein